MLDTIKKSYLEFVDLTKNSYKFYELELKDNNLIYNSGRIGSEGRLDYKRLNNELEAEIEFEKLLKKRVKQGYQISIKGFRPSLRGQAKGQLIIDFYN